MTPPQLQILQHALGVDEYGRGKQYRNHFAAGGEDVDTCKELIVLGYMRQVATTEVFQDFNCRVTDEGKAAMLRESPKPPVLTRGQQRYRHWLQVADVFPDWKFGDYLKKYVRTKSAAGGRLEDYV
jgi:hypothetical protein